MWTDGKGKKGSAKGKKGSAKEGKKGSAKGSKDGKKKEKKGKGDDDGGLARIRCNHSYSHTDEEDSKAPTSVYTPMLAQASSAYESQWLHNKDDPVRQCGMSCVVA